MLVSGALTVSRLHEGVAGVLERVLRAAVLVVHAREVLPVVAQRDRRSVGAQLVVDLDQEDVLVLAAVVGVGQRLQLREAGLRVRVGGQVAGRFRMTAFGFVLRWPS